MVFEVDSLLNRGSRAFLVIAAALCLLGAPGRAEHLPIRTWSTADGLPRDRVLTVFEDSRGFEWMGGEGWVARFDGNLFRIYSAAQGIPAAEVWQILETADGALWLATGDGPCRLALAPAASPWLCEHIGLTSAGDPIGIHALYADPSGNLWAATGDGLWRKSLRQGARFERVRLGIDQTADHREALRGLVADGAGGLWLATSRGVACRLPDGRVFQYPLVETRDDRVFSVLRDRRGRLWIAHVDEGLFVWMPPDAAHLPPTGWCLGCGARSLPAGGRLQLPERVGDVLHLSTRDGLADGRARNGLLESADGAIWAGTVSGLVRILDGRLEVLGRAQGFSDDALAPSHQDRSGNIWFGSASGGAMRQARGGMMSFGVEDGLPPGSIRQFVESPSGELFAVGDGARLLRLAGLRFESAALEVPPGAVPGWGWNQVVSRDDRGAWWWSMSTGIAAYPPAPSLAALARLPSSALYSAGLVRTDVFRLFRDRSGRVWAATIEPPTLLVLEPGAGALRRVALPGGVPLSPALAFAEDRSGTVWIGFDNGRLGAWSDGQLRLLDKVREADAIVALGFNSRQELWYVTETGGVAALRSPGSSPPEIRRLQIAPAPSSVEVTSLDFDRFDRPYIGTTAGVYRLDARSGRTTHLGKSDGLTNSVVRTVHRDQAGAMWFGTFQGLSRYQPEPPTRSAGAPGLRIVSLEIASHNFPLSELGARHLADLDLAPDENTMRFELAAPWGGERCTFATRLADAQRDFSPFSDNPVFSYAALRAGSFRLEARALCGDIETPVVSLLAFTVRAPFWQRGWFVGMSAALLLGLAWLFHRQRVARLVAVERVRRQIATDLHDDLGQSLSRIAILSEVVKRESTPDVARLNEIADTARQLSESASEIVWAIDPRRDDLDSLLVRLSRSAQELLADRGIGWQFDLPPDAASFGLHPDARRHIYLILKEAAHNAARHSGARSVELTLRREPHAIIAEMRDDGCGFTPPSLGDRSDGNGLRNMRERAAAFGGRVDLRTRPGEGTIVALWIPEHRVRNA